MTELILIQHCQSEHHVNGLTGGWTDTPLTDLGRRQAELTAIRLKKESSIDEFVLCSSENDHCYSWLCIGVYSCMVAEF